MPDAFRRDGAFRMNDVRASLTGRILSLALAMTGVLWGMLMILNPKGVESRVFFERGERLFGDFVSTRICAEFGYANDRQEALTACYPALGPALARPFPLSQEGGAWFTGIGMLLWTVGFCILLGRKKEVGDGETPECRLYAGSQDVPIVGKACLVIGLLLSSIMLHAFEWGNQILYAAAAVTVFVAWWDSGSRWRRRVAAAALAVAAVLKIVPAILVLLYLMRWRSARTDGSRREVIGDFVVFAGTCVVLFVVPFAWYGGWTGFCQWLSNAVANAKGYAHRSAWGTVPIGRTIRVMMHVDVAQPWTGLWIERGVSVIAGLFCCALAIRLIVKRRGRTSDVLLSLVAVMLLVPGNMHVYTGLYLLPVLALRLEERMGWVEAVCWFLMLCPLQIPFGAGCLNHPLANLAFLWLAGSTAFRTQQRRFVL